MEIPQSFAPAHELGTYLTDLQHVLMSEVLILVIIGGGFRTGVSLAEEINGLKFLRKSTFGGRWKIQGVIIVELILIQLKT